MEKLHRTKQEIKARPYEWLRMVEGDHSSSGLVCELPTLESYDVTLFCLSLNPLP